MNSKVNSVKQGGYESKHGCRTWLAFNLSHTVPSWPLYIGGRLKDRVGSDTDYNIDIRYELVFRLVLQLGLIYRASGVLNWRALLSIPLSVAPEILPELQIRVESQIFNSSTWSILDFFKSWNLRLGLSTYLFPYYLARGVDEQAWQLWRIKRSVNCQNRHLPPTLNSIPLDLNSGNRSNLFFCRI
jgi:hypothetical protein